MSGLILYGHPLSSYYQKAVTAFYENDTAFTLGLVEQDSAAAARLAEISPIGKFPVLEDGDAVVLEATTIIEYLDVHHPGQTAFIPQDKAAAIEVRMMDRIFDNYVHNPMQAIVAESFRPADARDPIGVAQARGTMDKLYAWLDARMAKREWAAGEAFSLADCAAAPALLYGDWAHPIPERYQHLWAYRTRLLQRPCYARAVDDARPYRHMFPLSAPEGRD